MIKRFVLIALSFSMLQMAACGDTGQTDTLPLAATSPTATDRVVRAEPTQSSDVDDGTEPVSLVEASTIDAFSTELQNLLLAQDWKEVEAISAEILQFGILPFAVIGRPANEAIGALQASYVLPNSTPTFANIVPEQIALPAFLYGTASFARVLYASGLGPDQAADGLIYIVDSADGGYQFGGMLLSYDQFALAPTLPVNAAPSGLLFTLDEQLWRVLSDGNSTPLFKLTPTMAWSVNPQGTRAIYYQRETKPDVMTVVYLDSGELLEIPLDASVLSGSLKIFDRWLNEHTAVIGVWLNQEEAGSNQGHLSVLDTNRSELTILDSGLLTSPPTVANGRITWSNFDGPAPYIYKWEDNEKVRDNAQALLALGITPTDASAFGPAAASDGRVAWWTKGVTAQGNTLVIVDDVNATSSIKISPPPMGGFPSAAVWSPDSRWLAVQAWTGLPSQDGIHLENTAARAQTFLGIGTRNPHWIGDEQLLYYQVSGAGQEGRIYNVTTGATTAFALPDGAVFAGFVAGAGAERDSAETSFQDITFPMLNIRLQVPDTWSASFIDETGYLDSNESFGDGPHPTRYTAWLTRYPNPDDLSAAQLYANAFDRSDLIDDIVAAQTVVDLDGGLQAIRSDFIFSAYGALGYFVEQADGYILLAMGPYDSVIPFEEQERLLAQFAEVVGSIDTQYQVNTEAQSTQLCAPLDEDSAETINLQFNPLACITWRDQTSGERFGYRIVLSYDDYAGNFDNTSYLAGASKRAVLLAPADQPCYKQNDTLVRSGSVMIEVLARTTQGESRVTGMAFNTDCQ